MKREMGTLAELPTQRESTVKSCGYESTQERSRTTTPEPNNCQLFPCHHPHNHSMQDLNTRIGSFADWPGHISATPRELAEAGLYYINVADRTKCFYCNGGLENWELNDCPWEEHAKFYPQCEYLLNKKGVEFVAEVRTRNPNPPSPVVHAPSSTGVSVINLRNTTIRLNGANIRPTSSPQTPRGPIFYQTILPGGNFVQESITGFGFNTTVQRPQSPPGTTNRVRSLEERTNEAMQGELARMMIEFGYPEDLVKGVISKKLGQSFSNEMFETASEFIDAIEEYSRQLERQSEVPSQEQEQMETEGAIGVNNNAESSPEDRIQELMREKRCKICLDQDSSCLFEPCGHLCACLSCGTRLQECPICRRRISTIRRVYTS